MQYTIEREGGGEAKRCSKGEDRDIRSPREADEGFQSGFAGSCDV